MKIVKVLEGSGLSIKGISEKLKMKQKNKKRGFLSTAAASRLWSALTGGRTITAGENFWWHPIF